MTQRPITKAIATFAVLAFAGAGVALLPDSAPAAAHANGPAGEAGSETPAPPPSTQQRAPRLPAAFRATSHGDSATATASRFIRGHVTANREVDLRAPFQETLLSVPVAEGDRVIAGEVVALLDDRLQSIVVEASRLHAESTSGMERAAVDHRDAEERLAVLEHLVESNAAAEEEVRQAKINVLRALVTQAEAAEASQIAKVKFELEQRRLDRHRILAPFDGVVVGVFADSGAVPVGDETILRLADLDTLKARLNVPVRLHGELVIGETYVLIAEEPINTELTATLQSIGPVIDTASQTFPCVLTIENAEARLPAGFAVQLKWEPDVDSGGSLAQRADRIDRTVAVIGE